MIVVSDTTPLHYLILIDEAEILHQIYGRVIVPAAVYNELQRAATPLKVRDWVTHKPVWVEVHQAPDITLSISLGSGEREALALALHLHADLILLDDAKGRKVASEFGLTFTGTLAVLAAAARAELIDLSKAIEKLRKTSFHASAKLIEEVLQREAERPPNG